MAEVVGLVASVGGMVGVGCQILESVFKLQRTLTAIQDAPQELKTILDEITIVTNVLVQCLDSPHPHTIGPRQAVARDQALVHCETACKHLFAIVSEIEDGTKGSKFRSRWYSVLAVLKGKKIADLVARLERAKTTLAIAQIMHLQSHVYGRSDCREENAPFAAVIQQPRLFKSSTGLHQDEGVYAPYTETAFQLGIGVLVVRDVRTTNVVQLSSLEGTSVQFRFADWFLRWGIMITVNREYRNFRMTIRPHRLVSADSAIFQACALGDGHAVARLIQEGKASPFDITSTGSTPLLVAAAWLRPSLCKQLLEYGADSSVSFHYDNLFWNPLGLAVERAGYYRYHMFPGLEKYRPEPQECLGRMRETMRVLTEHGSVEAHQGYQPGEFGHWNRSRSALHWFRGTSEDFSWIIKREKPLMTAREWDDYIASIVLQQTEMFPNDSFLGAFNTVSNMKSLAEYEDSSGSSLLHYLLDTNFGEDPGIWLNGVDIFTFVRTLLQHGANPTARNKTGNTPLMKFAQNIRRYFMSNDLRFNAEAAIELFSGFLARWSRVLKSCKIDLGKYRTQEVESGAEIFARCREFENDSSASVEPRLWFVRLVFEQIDTNQELQIKLQFQSRDKDKMMPGTWPDELADT